MTAFHVAVYTFPFRKNDLIEDEGFRNRYQAYLARCIGKVERYSNASFVMGEEVFAEVGEKRAALTLCLWVFAECRAVFSDRKVQCNVALCAADQAPGPSGELEARIAKVASLLNLSRHEWLCVESELQIAGEYPDFFGYKGKERISGAKRYSAPYVGTEVEFYAYLGGRDELSR